jgi:Zn finger protein HypA/HybF involved in hydrogenase expression
MTESSIANHIIERVEAELFRLGGGTVDAVYVRLGRTAGIVRDALRSSFELAKQHTALAASQLVIEDVPGTELLVTAMEMHS